MNAKQRSAMTHQFRSLIIQTHKNANAAANLADSMSDIGMSENADVLNEQGGNLFDVRNTLIEKMRSMGLEKRATRSVVDILNAGGEGY